MAGMNSWSVSLTVKHGPYTAASGVQLSHRPPNTMNGINIEEIVELTKLHPLKVRNIYLFGSRVYGTNNDSSDYDVLVTATNLLAKQQVFTDKYNIHVHVPSVFEDNLRAHDIISLECMWAPDFAKLQQKVDYSKKFVLDRSKLKAKILTQSHDAWHKAKMALNESDVLRGHKRIGHSFRILVFGLQILEHGMIVDFSANNKLYNEVSSSDEYEWDYFKEKYLPMKRELEDKAKHW